MEVLALKAMITMFTLMLVVGLTLMAIAYYN